MNHEQSQDECAGAQRLAPVLAICLPSSLFRKAVQQGRSKRRGESYSLPYVEPLSDARTPLADFFRILLETEGQAITRLPGEL